MTEINGVVHMEGTSCNKMASSATAGSIFEARRLGVFVTPHKAEKAGHSPQKGLHLQGNKPMS